MAHYSFLNEKQTIKNAKMTLEKYEYYHNLEVKNRITLQSPAISGMPSSPNFSNTQEEKIFNSMDETEIADWYCESVRATINTMMNETYRKILNNSYINPQKTESYLIDDLCVSRTRYYQLKNEALLVFAQRCPDLPYKDNYKKRGLLVRR